MWKISKVKVGKRGLEVHFVKIGQYDEILEEHIGYFQVWGTVTRSEAKPV